MVCLKENNHCIFHTSELSLIEIFLLTLDNEYKTWQQRYRHTV